MALKAPGCCCAAAAAAVLAIPALADPPETVTITSSKDNTLIETNDGSLSLGAASHFYAGRVGNFGGGTIRRGLLHFDIAGAVPEGATITEVNLTLFMSQTIAGPYDVALKRMLADWGEGTSNGIGGMGVPATNGDATWLHQFWPGIQWSTPGGDFVDTASAVTSVSFIDWYTWHSTPELVADVQGWLDEPATNFGWLMQGDETLLFTVKQFVSREGPADERPALEITYTMNDEPTPGDLSGDGSVGVPDLLLLLGAWGLCENCEACPADLTNDCSVGVPDLLLLLGNWG